MRRILTFPCFLLPDLVRKHQKFVLSLLAILITFTPLTAQVNMVMSPTSGTHTLNQTFTVDFNIEFIAGQLDGGQASVDFDNTVLQVVSASNAGSSTQLPNLLFPANFMTNPTAAIASYNSLSRIGYAANATSGFPTTNFTLLSVTFKVISIPAGGTTAVTFRRPPTGNPVTNATFAAASVLAGVTSATFNITACTPPTATITATAATCNAQPFNLILSNTPAPTGTGPYDLVINGTTYTGIAAGGTITTFVPPVQSLWPGNPTPTEPNHNDGQGVEVGTKFRASVDGFIKGARFYCGSSNAGTYTAKLYELGNTTPIASKAFTAVTANSWNQVLFTTPAVITAGALYIISYYSTAGNYTTDENYFLNSNFVNGDLEAVQDGPTPGENGIYVYNTGTGAYPDQTFNSTNYWVDPLFSASDYTFNLTSLSDQTGCTAVGAPIQSLVVTSVDCSTLPITLVNISATAKDKNITLQWTTSSEINNKGFEIQRSTTGRGGWETIGFVAGAGTSTSTRTYSFVDKDLSPKRYFYQLKQVDKDDNYKFSAVVSAQINGKISGYVLEQNFPNPFRNQSTNIRYTLPQKSQVTLTIYDLSGRVMKTLVKETQDQGTHIAVFEAGALTSGIYYYKIQAGDFSDVKKMTVQ